MTQSRVAEPYSATSAVMPGFCAYSRPCRDHVVGAHAYAQCRSNKGAPAGSDGGIPERDRRFESTSSSGESANLRVASSRAGVRRCAVPEVGHARAAFALRSFSTCPHKRTRRKLSLPSGGSTMNLFYPLLSANCRGVGGNHILGGMHRATGDADDPGGPGAEQDVGHVRRRSGRLPAKRCCAIISRRGRR